MDHAVSVHWTPGHMGLDICIQSRSEAELVRKRIGPSGTFRQSTQALLPDNDFLYFTKHKRNSHVINMQRGCKTNTFSPSNMKPLL